MFTDSAVGGRCAYKNNPSVQQTYFVFTTSIVISNYNLGKKSEEGSDEAEHPHRVSDKIDKIHNMFQHLHPHPPQDKIPHTPLM